MRTKGKHIKSLLCFILINCIWGCFQVKAQDVFYVSCDNAQLLKSSLNTCSVQNIGNMDGHVMFDIAITPNGSLYGTTGKKLYKIDTLTASTQLVGILVDSTLGYNLNSLVALDDNTLIAAGIYDTIYRINTANALKESIGVCGYAPAGDLTWYEGKLLLTEASNKLVEITLDADYMSVQNVIVLGTMNTPFASVYGAITIGEKSCTSNTLRVIGFEGGDVFFIDPTNANVSSACPAMLTCSAYGATSLSETKYQKTNAVVIAPNVFSPNGDGINDFFVPIIEGEWETLTLQIYNRWGVPVFLPENQLLSWNGKDVSGICAAGTYYYRIAGVNKCNEQVSFAGFVQLIR